MIFWSIGLGLLGSCGTGLWILLRSRNKAQWPPHWCWLLGLAGLFPSWLLVFLGLFGSSSDLDVVTVTLPPAAIFSSGAALLGVIGMDAAVRRLHASGRGHSPVLYWLLGVAALLPGWVMALVALLSN